MPHTSSQTLQDSAKLPAGTEIVVKGAQASCLSLPNEKATEKMKDTGKMPVLRYKITSTGKLIDDALEAVEKENPKLKNVPVASVYDRRTLKSRIAAREPNVSRPFCRRTKPRKTSDGRRPTLQLQIDPANLAGLIDLIATIPFQHADLQTKDILGHVYDWSGATKSLPKESPKGERGGAHQYFLGQFALAEGKKGGHWSGATKTSPQGSPKGWRGGANQYFTPKSIVSLIVEMIEPYQGRVYDPAMGSGGFFVGDIEMAKYRIPSALYENVHALLRQANITSKKHLRRP